MAFSLDGRRLDEGETPYQADRLGKTAPILAFPRNGGRDFRSYRIFGEVSRESGCNQKSPLRRARIFVGKSTM